MMRIRQVKWWWGVASVLVLAGVVRGEEPIPACRLGLELREALGFGPKVLAALAVEDQAQEAIIQAAAAFAEQNRQTIEPLLADLSAARQYAFRQYELNSEQVAAADAALLTAIDDVTAVCGDLVDDLEELLTSGQCTSQARLAANPRLDVRLALLDLSTNQYTQLRAAQRERDLIHRNHQSRKDLEAVREAQETFEAAVAQILSPDQQAAYAAFVEAQRQNLRAALTLEETLCPR